MISSLAGFAQEAGGALDLLKKVCALGSDEDPLYEDTCA